MWWWKEGEGGLWTRRRLWRGVGRAFCFEVVLVEGGRWRGGGGGGGDRGGGIVQV